MRLLPVEGEPVNDVDAVCTYIQAMGGTINEAYLRGEFSIPEIVLDTLGTFSSWQD